MFTPKLFIPSNIRATKKENSLITNTGMQNNAIDLLEWFGIDLNEGSEVLVLSKKGTWVSNNFLTGTATHIPYFNLLGNISSDPLFTRDSSSNETLILQEQDTDVFAGVFVSTTGGSFPGSGLIRKKAGVGTAEISVSDISGLGAYEYTSFISSVNEITTESTNAFFTPTLFNLTTDDSNSNIMSLTFDKNGGGGNHYIRLHWEDVSLARNIQLSNAGILLYDGNVGIENITPSATLTIGRTDLHATYLQTIGTNGYDFNIYSYPEDNNIFRINGDDQRIYFDEGGSGWNVGIGTGNPNTTLCVFGDFRLKDGTEGVGKTLISDSNGVTSWQAFPDALTNLPEYAVGGFPANAQGDGYTGKYVTVTGVTVGLLTLDLIVKVP